MKRNLFFILASSLGLSFILTETAFAQQSLDDNEIISLEQEYSKPKPKPVPPRPSKIDNRDSEATTSSNQAEAPLVEEEKDNQLKDFSGLGKLAPFREISVIQKKYLPKTGRFQLFGGVSMTTNNPWFLNLGANLKIGYHFVEAFGVEFSYSAMGNSDRQVTEEALDIHRIRTEELIYAKSYMGLDLQWSAIYGKMSWFNKKIVPFDIYFNLGGGQTTVSTGGNEFTLHFGVGQVFALGRSSAFRWDYSYSTYEAKGVDNMRSRYNDLILTGGFSFFWPEARYR